MSAIIAAALIGAPASLTGAATIQQARTVDTTGLCSVVIGRDRAPPTAWYRYEFEGIFYRAAGATEKDAPEDRARKVRHVWDNHQPAFRCTTSDFDVREGNILKYAVSRESYQILNSAIAQWKLNLNHVDPSDNRTLLDYIAVQMERNETNPSYPQLERYYQLVRRSGGKLRSELP